MTTSDKNFKVKNGLDATGDITTSGDVKGTYLRSLNSTGDEGGELFLSKPQTNTTIAGTGVTVDVWQNKLRIFEQGGDARGYYIDITGGGNGATTNLVGGGSASDSFKTISVSGQDNVVADSSTDTLTLVAGSNVTITTNASTDSITLNATDTNTTYSAGTGLTLSGTEFVINTATTVDLTTTQTLTNKTITGLTTEPALNTNTAQSIGYVGMPQVPLASGGLTLSKAHAGEHIYVTGTGQTITIPDNGSVPFEIGTTIVIINAADVTTSIAITTDTLLLAGAGTTGTRTLGAHGMATCVKITATSWIISGNGLT